MLVALRGGIKDYAWGKAGADSAVAALQKASDPAFVVDPHTTYAELWFSTHPSAQARLAQACRGNSDGQQPPEGTLAAWLKANAWALGVASHGSLHAAAQPLANSASLPFLLKVLSVDKALSIQAHPTRQQAQELHAANPDAYPDANHKPEMLVAITPFEALCGLRPLPELVFFTANVAALAALVGEAGCAALKSAALGEGDVDAAVKGVLSTLLHAPPELLVPRTQELLAQAESARNEGSQQQGVEGSEEEEEEKEEEGRLRARLGDALCLVPRLHAQFPNDVGVFVSLLLNFHRLAPGESLFLSAGLLHAYVSGDCIEVMSASDNVVRAGLTPKLKDVDTLCAIVDTRCGGPQHLPAATVREVCSDGVSFSLFRYSPPIDEFEAERVVAGVVGEGEAVELPPSPGVSLVLCVDGHGVAQAHGAGVDGTPHDVVEGAAREVRLARGGCVAVSAGAGLRLTKCDGLLAFRVQVNSLFSPSQ